MQRDTTSRDARSLARRRIAFHEPLALGIEQIAALAAGAFGDQACLNRKCRSDETARIPCPATADPARVIMPVTVARAGMSRCRREICAAIAAGGQHDHLGAEYVDRYHHQGSRRRRRCTRHLRPSEGQCAKYSMKNSRIVTSATGRTACARSHGLCGLPPRRCAAPEVPRRNSACGRQTGAGRSVPSSVREKGTPYSARVHRPPPEPGITMILHRVDIVTEPVGPLQRVVKVPLPAESGVMFFRLAAMPPCAATVWERVGKTLVMQAVRNPCSAIPSVARSPAPPAHDDHHVKRVLDMFIGLADDPGCVSGWRVLACLGHGCGSASKSRVFRIANMASDADHDRKKRC